MECMIFFFSFQIALFLFGFFSFVKLLHRLGCDVGYGLMHRIPIAASALPHDENDDSECSDEEEEEDEERMKPI